MVKTTKTETRWGCFVLTCVFTYVHYITLHYITLHCIALHYIALHCITLHYITFHYIYLHTLLYTQIYIYLFVYAFPLSHGICMINDSGEEKPSGQRVRLGKYPSIYKGFLSKVHCPKFNLYNGQLTYPTLSHEKQGLMKGLLSIGFP